MTSGFVSGGTIDAPIERSDEWLKAQQELEANRARKAAEAQRSDGRSLYETLEANKAAKQEAFEEANKLKNQFRALDEDEIEFLDSVLESTRAEEERVKRETAVGLEAFRKQQEKADKLARVGDDAEVVEEPTAAAAEWAAGGRKRKRTKEKEGLKGVKVRRSSSGKEIPPKPAASTSTSASTDRAEDKKSKDVELKKEEETKESHSTPAKTKGPPAPAPVKSGLGLVSYGSDDEDE